LQAQETIRRKRKADPTGSRSLCVKTANILTACLPLQTQREANIAFAIRTDDPHEVRRGYVCRSRIAGCATWIVEVRRIREIVEFRLELQLEAFLDREHALDAHVCVPNPGTSQIIPPG